MSDRTAVGRRRYPRFAIAGLRGHLVVPMEIEVLNLSLGGIAIETSGYLRFDRAYRLKIHTEPGCMALNGRVAWCSLSATRLNADGEVVPVYRAGLKFEALSGHRVRDLWQLIQDHALVDLEDSLSGRFRVELPRAAELGSSHDFEVRKISLGGMLIETDCIPEANARFRMQMSLAGGIWDAVGRLASTPGVDSRSSEEPSRLGVEFCGLSAMDRERLRQFIESCLEKHGTAD